MDLLSTLRQNHAARKTATAAGVATARTRQLQSRVAALQAQIATRTEVLVSSRANLEAQKETLQALKDSIRTYYTLYSGGDDPGSSRASSASSWLSWWPF